jgi:hypothetical protein
MKSCHAPNRNPAEASFAAVDGRLTKVQQEEMLNLIKYYEVSCYWINQDKIVSMMHADGFCIGYIDRTGKFIPEF